MGTTDEILRDCPDHLKDRFRKQAAVVSMGKQRAPAIKLKCLECCAWQIAEVHRCEIRGCALWEFRPTPRKERHESETTDEA